MCVRARVSVCVCGVLMRDPQAERYLLLEPYTLATKSLMTGWSKRRYNLNI